MGVSRELWGGVGWKPQAAAMGEGTGDRVQATKIAQAARWSVAS